MKGRWLLWCAALLCTNLQAQTVYRCGPDGREYSQAPCPQGRAVDVSDPRSERQRAEAQSLAQDEQARGNALERERLDREAGRAPAAGHIKSRPAPAPAASAASHPQGSKKKKKKRTPQPGDHDFKAVAPAQKKPRP